MLLWNSQEPTQTKAASDAVQPGLWVVDGKQRATALCILSGRKPYWWPDGGHWDATLKKYAIRFDIAAKKAPYFWVANAAIRKVRENKYIPLSEILALDLERDADQQRWQDLAKAIKQQKLCEGMDAMEV